MLMPSSTLSCILPFLFDQQLYHVVTSTMASSHQTTVADSAKPSWLMKSFKYGEDHPILASLADSMANKDIEVVVTEAVSTGITLGSQAKPSD